MGWTIGNSNSNSCSILPHRTRINGWIGRFVHRRSHSVYFNQQLPKNQLLLIITNIHYSDQIGKLYLRLRRETSGKTDNRIRMINEIIPAIRVIKMYAWEKHFIQMAKLYRKLEMKVIRRTSYLRACNSTLNYISSKLYIFPTLVVLVLSGNELTPEKVWSFIHKTSIRAYIYVINKLLSIRSS